MDGMSSASMEVERRQEMESLSRHLLKLSSDKTIMLFVFLNHHLFVEMGLIDRAKNQNNSKLQLKQSFART
eukprot:scaffold38184_cov153-Skeletonema_marinoi.AAC.3